MIKSALILAVLGLGAIGHLFAEDAPADQLAEGKKNYMLICIACHQATGMGLPAVFPPLTNSVYVAGSADRLAAIILKGNAGPFVMDGKPFNHAWARSGLDRRKNCRGDDFCAGELWQCCGTRFCGTGGGGAGEVCGSEDPVDATRTRRVEGS
jgi:hypothetical protein